jgi:hypothetical protein
MSLRRLSFPSCLLLCCLSTWSCGSSGVSLASDYSSRSDPGVPVVSAVEADKVVRPDVLTVRFAVRQETEFPVQALSALKAAVDRYVRAVAEATKAEVVPHLTGFAADSGYSRKLSSGDAAMSYGVHGSLELAMPATLDFWGRTELVAKLLQVARASATEAEKQNLRFSFEQPAPALRDAEAHRAALLKRWAERTRTFALSTQSEGAPLAPVECTPPGEVQQKPLSLEEVALTLPVSCRLAVVPTATGGKAVAASGK